MATYDWRPGGFGLYLHWPFCESKCPYCDFNSHVVDRIDQVAWRDAYLAELTRYADLLGDRLVQSVYFGGGTPSLMDAGLVSDIIKSIAAQWRCANDLEITLEANPSSVEATRFRAYRDAGVNRVSLGVQALRDPDLKALGRLHDRNDALAALEIAKRTFERVSFDLIYARQNQSLESWQKELAEAMELAGDHLSLYQLTLEEGTVFHERARRGKLGGLPDESLAADMFELTQEMTRDAGMPAYEVSNHAIPGHESRHNMIYWRGGDYVGIGPGAHGRITIAGVRRATETFRAPTVWLQSVREKGYGESAIEVLTREDQATEYLLMSLRTHEGLDLARHQAMADAELNTQKMSDLISLGLVEMRSGHLVATQSGRPLLNEIIRQLSA